MDVAREQFALVVRSKSDVSQATSDPTPTRPIASNVGNAGIVAVYARAVFPRAGDGEEMEFIPHLKFPANSTAAGVLSAIPIKDIFIEELTPLPCLRVLLVRAEYRQTKPLPGCLLASFEFPPISAPLHRYAHRARSVTPKDGV